MGGCPDDMDGKYFITDGSRFYIHKGGHRRNSTRYKCKFTGWFQTRKLAKKALKKFKKRIKK